MENKTLTLYELNRLVHEVVEEELPHTYWVEAELSEAREVRGHCYMELVQYDVMSQLSGSTGRTPIARASAKCWQKRWSQIRPRFEQVTGQPLHAGMKVLLSVSANFHEAYGFSWIVSDIDPTYTIGDMARKRQEIIRTLHEEGIFDLQRELKLSPFARRIAVISSENAAGYGDFCNQLADNEYGFSFVTQLFPAIMQGEQVEESVIAALDRIYGHPDFDCVVIIRGGGATADLSGFDTLALAENVAQFPLPVITGIGHERDESIIDMVSHTRVKTPTAAAAFLIDNLATTLSAIDNLQTRAVNSVKDRISAAMAQLSLFSSQLPSLAKYCIQRKRHRLELLAQRTLSLDPTQLLRRGYSITLKDGHIVHDACMLQPGDEIETILENGKIQSIIK